MPRFAANLNWLFLEAGFRDRFKLAQRAGFKALEIQFPYELPADEVGDLRRASGLPCLMFNGAAGDLDRGEYGLAALPGREADFRAGIKHALTYAQALESAHVHVLAGIIPDGADPEACRAVYLQNLAWAADVLADEGVGVLIEPINTRDRPGYFLTRTDQARVLIEDLNHANVGIQYDFHNAQMMEGDLARTIEANLDLIRHMQVAGMPGRTPPGEGEANDAYLFDLVDRLGYTGWIGCEYKPAGSTAASLAWAAPYGISGETITRPA